MTLAVENLTQEPEILTWPETHYVFVEKTGPIPQNAPKAWQELFRSISELLQNNQIATRFSLYKMGPPEVYRAGIALTAPPVALPAGLSYEKFSGGKYSRLTYTGPYSGLPQASGRAWQIAAEKVNLRDDFTIEHYLNDPMTTSEDQLVTEILFPTA